MGRLAYCNQSETMGSPKVSQFSEVPEVKTVDEWIGAIRLSQSRSLAALDNASISDQFQLMPRKMLECQKPKPNATQNIHSDRQQPLGQIINIDYPKGCDSWIMDGLSFHFHPRTN